MDEPEPGMIDEHDYMEDGDNNINYEEPISATYEKGDGAEEENPQDLLAAAGLEDSDDENEVVMSHFISWLKKCLILILCTSLLN